MKNRKNVSELIKELQWLINTGPSTPENHLSLANLYLQADEVPKAMHMTDRYLSYFKKNPSEINPQIYKIRGLCLYQLQRQKESLGPLVSYLRKQPDDQVIIDIIKKIGNRYHLTNIETLIPK